MTFWWLDRFLVHIVKTDEINRYNRNDGSEAQRTARPVEVDILVDIVF